MKKWSFWLGIYSMICMLGGFVSVIINAPICTYILASFGMLFSILAWYVAKRERDTRRLVFRPIVPSQSEQEWIEAMNQQECTIASSCAIPPQLLGERKIFKMPEEWDTFVQELRKP